ncbi:unnamed protein product, partial [Mesorhabditis spiculigera]
MIAAYHTEDEEETEIIGVSQQKENAITLGMLFVTFIVFLPVQVEGKHLHLVLQIIVTVAGALFLWKGAKSTLTFEKLHFGYIGAISYALYLVHFPILRIGEYLGDFYNHQPLVTTTTLFATFSTAIFAHHIYEKPLLKFGLYDNAYNTLKYFLICWLIFWTREWIVKPGCVENATVAANAKFRNSVYRLEGGKFIDDGFGKSKPPFGHYSYQNNTGFLKIVIIGNSWATQQAHIVRKLFPPSTTSSMDLFSLAGHCIGMHQQDPETEFVMSYLEGLQPDYIFVLLRYVMELQDYRYVKRRDDEILERYRAGIGRMSKTTKKLFLELDSPYKCDEKNGNVSTLDFKYDEPAFLTSNPRKRLRNVLNRCKNCYPIDLSEPFIDRQNQILKTYDKIRKLAYFDNTCHLTDVGLGRIEKPFQQAVEKALNHTLKH